MEITDRAEVEAQLEQHQIPITDTIEFPNGTVFFFVRDPDGNVIEFHKPVPWTSEDFAAMNANDK